MASRNRQLVPEARAGLNKFKMEAAQEVGVNLTDGSHNSNAQSIVIVGNDVYVSGYEKNSSKIPVAKYWKNGVAVSLTDGTNDANASGIVLK